MSVGCFPSAGYPPCRALITGSNRSLNTVYDSSSPATKPTVLMFGCPLLSIPVFKHLASVTPFDVFSPFSLSYNAGSFFSSSTAKLLCSDKSGKASGHTSPGNVAPFSEQMYSAFPHPSWIHSGNFFTAAVKPFGGYSGSDDPAPPDGSHGFAASIIASMFSPASNFCSHSMNVFTPRMNTFTKCVSLFPRRSALLMSNRPSVDTESTPAVPRACRPSFAHTVLKSGRADSFGTFTIVPARRPVPKFEGHVRMYPKWSLCMKSYPSARNTFPTPSVAAQKRLKIASTLSPTSMEMMRMWSSSFTQTKKFRASLWKIPRASGQCRPHPLDSNNVESGSWNRFPAFRNSSSFSSLMPVGFGAYERDPCNGK
mmetsp:Transcript_21077/g.50985  ORF Transcript_21077/g.50985 Transcript_21077/m.50985 type:complete len:369 (-) Transcript_21077:794-1900(-)